MMSFRVGDVAETVRTMDGNTIDHTPDLVYDVGLHRGEDTDFYLKKGFRVVAFEANPELVVACRRAFATHIANGGLTIVEGAIAPASSGDRVRFYRNALSIWGTVHSEWNERNLRLGKCSNTIEVSRVDFGGALRRYGVPLFMKIDIEGSDRIVLEALRQCPVRPKYLSVESEKVDFGELELELALLRDLGYSRFRAVQQKTIPGRSIVTIDLRGSKLHHTFAADASGPFGDDLPQPWESYEEIIETYRRIFRLYNWFGDGSRLRRLKGGWRLIDAAEWLTRRPLPGWYDTHATW